MAWSLESGTIQGMHTHFGSATHLLAVLLEVLIAATFWRLAALHATRSKSRTVSGLGRAALAQL